MLVVAVKHWGKYMSRKRVLIHCDNEVTVRAVNTGRSRDQRIQACLREIHQISGLFSCEIKAVFLEGKSNRLSDSLSRWHFSKSFQVDFMSRTTAYDLQTEMTGVFIYQHKKCSNQQFFKLSWLRKEHDMENMIMPWSSNSH